MLTRILAELDLDDLLETHEAIGELAEEMAVAEDSHPLKMATQRVLNSTTLLIRANTTPLDEWSRGEIAAYSLLTGLIIGLITPVTLPSTETDIDIDTSGRERDNYGSLS